MFDHNRKPRPSIIDLVVRKKRWRICDRRRLCRHCLHNLQGQYGDGQATYAARDPAFTFAKAPFDWTPFR